MRRQAGRVLGGHGCAQPAIKSFRGADTGLADSSHYFWWKLIPFELQSRVLGELLGISVIYFSLRSERVETLHGICIRHHPNPNCQQAASHDHQTLGLLYGTTQLIPYDCTLSMN